MYNCNTNLPETVAIIEEKNFGQSNGEIKEQALEVAPGASALGSPIAPAFARIADIEAAREQNREIYLCRNEAEAELIAAKTGVLTTAVAGGFTAWEDIQAGIFANLDVVVYPNECEDTAAAVETVAKSLSGVAARLRVYLFLDPFYPDITVWFACCGDAAKNEFFAGVAATPEWTPAASTTDKIPADTSPDEAATTAAGRLTDGIPPGFVLNEQGLFWSTKDDKLIFVSKPLIVKALMRGEGNGKWTSLLEFVDPDGQPHEVAIERSMLGGDARECLEKLLEQGLIINLSNAAKSALTNYIIASNPERRIRTVARTGWSDGAFVLPEETIGRTAGGEELMLAGSAAHRYRQSGTLLDWQRNIARYCAGNTRLVIAVCCAFAATLLDIILGSESGGFHFRGNSSIGKTTLLLVAGSVWGGEAKKGNLETWRATANGIEAVAYRHNHALLCLDEIGQVDARQIGDIVYMLANGFGKSRMNRNAELRVSLQWQLLFVSSGEKSLTDILEDVGRRPFAGQEVRFCDIEADANRGMGLFENLHDFDSAERLASHLGSASKEFYGTAIRAFLNQITGDLEGARARVNEIRRRFMADVSSSDAVGEIARVADRFALLAAAGELAQSITGWEAEEAYRSAREVFLAWIAARDTTGHSDLERGVLAVKKVLEAFGNSRFENVAQPSDFPVHNRLGFKKTRNGEVEFLIFPEMFKTEVCKGFDYKAIAKELINRGHMRRGSEENYLLVREAVPGLDRPRFYAIKESFIADSNPDEPAAADTADLIFDQIIDRSTKNDDVSPW